MPHEDPIGMPTADEMTITAGTAVRLGGLALLLGEQQRITRHEDGKTPESVTTHSVMLGLVGCALASRWFPGLNVGRVAQYALIHDLVEAYAGDTPTLRPQSDRAKAEKKDREQAAFIRIHSELGDLPWVAWTIHSYENLATAEARFVKMLDKLLPKITHILNGIATVIEQGMTRDELAARYELQCRELEVFADEFPEVEALRKVLVGEVLQIADTISVRCPRCTGTNIVAYRLMPEHNRDYHGR